VISELLAEGVEGADVALKGLSERRRTAWVMVGWNRPPWGEWANRWHGRVFPRLKNSEVNLQTRVSRSSDGQDEL
jgi:hypothetical protein